jgi:hypothetical protein
MSSSVTPVAHSMCFKNCSTIHQVSKNLVTKASQNLQRLQTEEKLHGEFWIPHRDLIPHSSTDSALQHVGQKDRMCKVLIWTGLQAAAAQVPFTWEEAKKQRSRLVGTSHWSFIPWEWKNYMKDESYSLILDTFNKLDDLFLSYSNLDFFWKSNCTDGKKHY